MRDIDLFRMALAIEPPGVVTRSAFDGAAKRHWNAILRWFHSPIANGIAVNSLVQAAKAMARWYRSIRNLKAIIYLIAAKLKLALPR